MVFLEIPGYTQTSRGYHGLNLHGFSGDIRSHSATDLIYMVFLPISVSRMSWPKFTWFFCRYQVTQTSRGCHGLNLHGFSGDIRLHSATDIDDITKGYCSLNLHGFSADIRLHRRLEDVMA